MIAPSARCASPAARRIGLALAGLGLLLAACEEETDLCDAAEDATD